ncbi:hypothetical protein BT63DRAFT_167675 [Microthyrium microscopicum]|uniref:Uncharacterized protein n=1 Tax=Microthyrium microscopicum TaxID=703497 RepID=A0A6A6UQW6_9PEZI|nr:hypothetical protein BT63DRAFT_167675 [Microthyrium microscopicum]
MATVTHSVTTVTSQNMNHQFQNWSFEKAMVEAQQRSPSESSSADFFDAEDKMRIPPTMGDFKRTLEEQRTPITLDERYMSSEEQLSPAEHDGEESDMADDTSIYETETFKVATCDMAVAICIISVGRAKVVDVPIPSLTSSPTISSEIERPIRSDSITKPFSAIPRKAIFLQEQKLRTRHSASSFARLSTPVTSDLGSQTDIQTSLNETPSRRNSIFFRNFTANSSFAPKPLAHTSTLPSFLGQDPYEAIAKPRQQHSRIRNLSQKIGRFAMYGPSGKPDSADSIDAPVSKLRKLSTSTGSKRSSLEPSRPLTPQVSSAPKRKMIARGADERAPPIEIPPCPYDLDEDGELLTLDRMLRRKSLVAI